MAVIVPIVSKFDDKGIKKAQSEFGKLGSSMKGLLGAAGIGLGLSAVTNALKDSTKAAIDDVKSQALLAQQLRNTVGASDGQIAAVERSIAAMQTQASVADDVIRPAFATLVRSTGDVARATELTSLALDVAAGTGKDLGAVSLALGKAVNGSTTSLLKLVPSIKGAANPMKELAKQFDGAAEAASNSDPLKAIGIVFGEIQEQIGSYLLPALQDLATYFKSEEFAGAVDSAFKGFDKIFAAVDVLTGAVPLLGKAFNGLGQELADGNWVKFIPIIGAYVDILSGLKPTAATGGSVLDQYKYNTGQFGKKATTTGDKGPTGPSDAEKKAAAAAKAAADKAAKARKAIIDAAQIKSDDAAKALKELGDAVTEFADSFDAASQAFKNVFRFAAPLGEFEQQAVDAFQSMRDAAQEAFDAGLFGKTTGDATLANLKAYADREQALLQGIARDRDVLAKKISIAQSVIAGVMGSLNITSMLETETKQVTKSVTSLVNGIALTTTQTFDEVVSGGLADSFKKLVDKTKTFAANLNKLKTLGLNGNLFKQIVEAGAESGNATAEAIISGGADAVKELNGLFTELTDAGAEIAKTSTPILYDLGENMTNSFIDGLRSQDQQLIDSANSMAALFTEQFKSQLNMAIAPTVLGAQSTAVQMQSALDLSKRPDPTRSPQSYAAWLSSIGGIDPIRSPQSYAAAQTAAGATYNVTINAGAITDQAALPTLVTNALVTATKQGLTGGLSRLLAV